jgi:hypothetical protein
MVMYVVFFLFFLRFAIQVVGSVFNKSFEFDFSFI